MKSCHNRPPTECRGESVNRPTQRSSGRPMLKGVGGEGGSINDLDWG